MQVGGTYSCAAPGCEAEHDSWQRVARCIHCDATVCRSDCYRELPIVDSFMNRTRRCPDCNKPMDD